MLRLLLLTLGATLVTAPSERYDLKLWNLTLPIAGKDGHAKIVATKDFVDREYFYLADDGALIFRVPTTGVTTRGSHYPRTELRELDAKGKHAAWTVEQGGTLTGELAVLEEPVTTTGKKGRMIIGQIHGPDDELCRLYFDRGKLYFIDDKAGPKLEPTRFELKDADGKLPHVALGEKFSYVIKASAKELRVTAHHKGTSYSAAEPISRFWTGKPLYFKQGVYLNVGKIGGAGTVGTGFGKVAFYAIGTPTHP